MSKKFYFFIIANFFLFFNQHALSKETLCKNINQFSFHNYYMEVDEIVIKLVDKRKWDINAYKTLLDIQKQNPSYLSQDTLGKINNKYKKKFKALINVKLKNGNICSFKGKVRQQGDIMDHIQFLDNGNFVNRSLNVTLDSGNINGITKFYLFIKETRGEDEVLFVEILKELNFLAPKSFFVKTNVNGFSSEMLFQEKISKEFLESFNRREGPLFEVRDKFRFIFHDHADDLKASKLGLAKQTNSSWAKKGDIYKDISHHSFSIINKFFLSSNITKVINNSKINLPVVNLDPTYLSNSNKKQKEIINEFSILIFSGSGLHSLLNTNRKFYWNSLKNFFEPIYYDGSITIKELNLDKIDFNIYNYPNQQIWIDSINKLISNIENIDVDIFYENLRFLDPHQTKETIYFKKKIILDNLILLKENYEQLLNETSLIEDKNLGIIEESYKTYETLRKNNDFKNHYLVFLDKDNNKFLDCKNINSNSFCKEVIFDQKQKYKILTDPVLKDDKFYHYIGFLNNKNKDLENSKYFLNQKNIYDSILFYDDGIEVNWKKNDLKIEIKQNREDARAYFLGGNLIDLNITFSGIESKKNIIYKNQVFDRIDKRGLTGCLTFVDVFFKNVSVKASNANCEDSVNIINSVGKIKELNVSESAYDGIDLDFSDLNIENIFVNKSGNDCVDVSYGNYIFNEVNVSSCGDKGISVGERSFLSSDVTKVEMSNVGLASKDSSTTKLNELEINNVNTCISLYKKKQEFFGSNASLKKFVCKNFINRFSIDNYSSLKMIKN